MMTRHDAHERNDARKARNASKARSAKRIRKDDLRIMRDAIGRRA